MQILTEVQKIVQILLKGDDYETACPNNEDTWYNLDDLNYATKELLSVIGEEPVKMLENGEIDFIVCRGNW